MLKVFLNKAYCALCAIGVFAFLQSGVVEADDTEIYQSTYSSSVSARPQVLVIFDDSGSM